MVSDGGFWGANQAKERCPTSLAKGETTKDARANHGATGGSVRMYEGGAHRHRWDDGSVTAESML